MAETNRNVAPVDRTIRTLTSTYRSILQKYGEIERLSREERELLSQREPIASVNELLRKKTAILAEIRAEEESVKAAREWWKKARKPLPRGGGEELLSLLDAISRTVETTLALETECRGLLDRSLAWGGPGPARGHASVAARAYRQPHSEGSAR